MEMSRSWSDVNGNPSHPTILPFRATIYYRDNSPGLHGWVSRSQVFATLDEALTVAAMPMTAGAYRVDVDVAKNRETWTVNGYWERIGQRKTLNPWKFAKGWNEARVQKVREYLAK